MNTIDVLQRDAILETQPDQMLDSDFCVGAVLPEIEQQLGDVIKLGVDDTAEMSGDCDEAGALQPPAVSVDPSRQTGESNIRKLSVGPVALIAAGSILAAGCGAVSTGKGAGHRTRGESNATRVGHAARDIGHGVEATVLAPCHIMETVIGLIIGKGSTSLQWSHDLCYGTGNKKQPTIPAKANVTAWLKAELIARGYFNVGMGGSDTIYDTANEDGCDLYAQATSDVPGRALRIDFRKANGKTGVRVVPMPLGYEITADGTDKTVPASDGPFPSAKQVYEALGKC